MLIDIPFPVISTTQSLIHPTQIFPIDYSDITAHRSHHTLHFLLFVSLLHTQHATSMSNPTSLKTFKPDARNIFIPCYIWHCNYGQLYSKCRWSMINLTRHFPKQKMSPVDSVLNNVAAPNRITLCRTFHLNLQSLSAFSIIFLFE